MNDNAGGILVVPLVLVIVISICWLKHSSEEEKKDTKRKIETANSHQEYKTTEKQPPRPNEAGQYIEIISYDNLHEWISSHRNDRKIVSITGLGRGTYGVNNDFIIVSESIGLPY